MWTPTHVQVTVQRAKGLLLKGKNGTNDAFVTISLGKEKYQTSVKERALDPVDWHEECELAIPRHGNKAEIVLNVLHRNFIGDEFLGQVTIPLSDFDVYDKPKNRWYNLKCKPGQDKTNYRGEIEVRVSFTVQSGVSAAGSLTELKKDGIRASFGQLSQKVGSSIGGSLLSLKGKGDKKGLKSFAKAVGSKVNKVSTLPGRGHRKKGLDDNFGAIPEQQSGGSTSNLSGSQHATGGYHHHHRQSEADPGVISDDEDEFRFDELSHKSSHSSLSASQVALGTPRDGSLENLGGGEFLRRNYATTPPAKTHRNSDQLGGGAPPEKPERWSTGPVDDWETKLFGKQQTILDKASASSSLKSLGRNSVGKMSNAEEMKEEKGDEKRGSMDENDSPLKPTFQSIFSTSVSGTGPSSPVVGKDSKEPVPKPRHSSSSTSSSPLVPKSKSEEKVKKSPAPPPPLSSSSGGVSKNSSPNQKEEEKKVEVPSKPPHKIQSHSSTTTTTSGSSSMTNGGRSPQKDSSVESKSSALSKQQQQQVLSKDPLTMVTPTKQQTNSSKSNKSNNTNNNNHTSSSSSSSNNNNNNNNNNLNDGGDEIGNNQKWTPVGITNPIRQKESQSETRLPREVMKKFENRSREDLIELIVRQQTTLEYQKQKMNDMEDYIDNLLVRVMENKPTLLQTPYVTHRPMKFTADTCGDWFALSD